MRVLGLRDPDEETSDYPGLVVHDGRVTGSITTGESRLPLWCFVSQAVVYGWNVEVKGNYDPEQYGWTKEHMGSFLYHLLEQRGDFARLICVLADVERRAARYQDWRPWTDVKTSRKRVVQALKACIEALES